MHSIGKNDINLYKNNAFSIIILTIILIGIFHILTIRDGHRWAGDFSMYIHHAKNIVEGKTYGDTGYIYNPHYPQLGPKTYPPVFPLLLTPVYKFFGLQLTPMKIEIIIFFLFSLFILYFIIRREIPAYYQIFLIIVIGLNPFFWDFKDYVLSDLPFLLFVLLSLIIIHRYFQKKNISKNGLYYGILIGLLFYLSFGTKTIGFILLPSLFIFDLLKNRKPSRFIITPTIVFLILMILQTILIHSDSDYFDQFLPFRPIYIIHNILIYTDSMIQFFDNGYQALSIIRYSLFFILLFFAFIGYISRWKYVSIYEIFIPLYFSIVILWPTHQGFRFLIPVIPFFMLYSFIGIMKVSFFLSRRFQNIFLLKNEKILISIILVIILTSYITKYTSLDFRPIKNGVHKRETIELFHFISDSTEESAVFLFKNPRILNLYTDRRASVYFNPSNIDDLWEYVLQIGATHLIYEKNGPAYLNEFIQEYQSSLEDIFNNDDFRVFRVNDNTID